MFKNIKNSISKLLLNNKRVVTRNLNTNEVREELTSNCLGLSFTDEQLLCNISPRKKTYIFSQMFPARNILSKLPDIDIIDLVSIIYTHQLDYIREYLEDNKELKDTESIDVFILGLDNSVDSKHKLINIANKNPNVNFYYNTRRDNIEKVTGTVSRGDIYG